MKVFSAYYIGSCITHCSTDSIPLVHHSREEGSLDYDGRLVRYQVYLKFNTNIYRQEAPFSGAVAGNK
jgi:hypothetical protein